MKLSVVILAGGHGSRLWPASRSSRPKQFINMHGADSMLQSTIKRLAPLNIESSIFICHEDHRFLVAEQLKEIDSLGRIILEPCSKGTAPAIALASLSLDEDSILLVLSADHIFQNDDDFVKTIKTAIPYALEDKLVTFGIVPNKVETGYGYIKKGQKHKKAYIVDKFYEKPDFNLAKMYFESGEYLWNSGMFIFKASKYLNSLESLNSKIFDVCCKAMKNLNQEKDFLRVSKEIFELCPNDSIDYAVFEKTDDAVVVPMKAGWNDIGSWSSLWDVSKKDTSGNVTKGDIILHNTQNSYLESNDKLVAAVGLDDIVVISDKDAVLVASKTNAQDVKLITSILKESERPEWELHREVYRPWGKFDSVDSGDGFQVKRITVYPKQKLSVQLHYHRSEHWIVVSGSGRVHYGDKFKDLNVNDSTYHGVEVMHALENLSDEDLILIEVQIGSYLGEDDIVRFSDNYGRV